METFGLFNDKTSSSIVCEFLSVDPEEKERIQIKTFITDRDVKESIDKGVWAAYHILQDVKFRSQHLKK